jgi:hypothetical protein
MSEVSNNSKENFFYPIGKYNGEFTPENLVFNANLQEFAQKTSYFCGLEANGKMTPEDTYEKIKQLWQQLKHSKKELLDNTKFTDQE